MPSPALKSTPSTQSVQKGQQKELQQSVMNSESTRVDEQEGKDAMIENLVQEIEARMNASENQPVPENSVDVDTLYQKAENLIQELGIDKGAAPRHVRATRLYCYARMKIAQGQPGAKELLFQAVKLHPRRAGVWNCLAELLWRDGDLKQAHDCLLSSLEQSPDKVTLRNLSMLLRKLEGSAKEKADHMSESIIRAKEAVALDINDAESWYVLANAYMAMFFAMSHDHRDLESALKAYYRSENLETGRNNPDLFYNRAQVLAFMEHFSSAIADYERADMLDRSLGAGALAKSLREQVKSTAMHIDSKGRIKPKRLATLRASLEEYIAQPGHEQISVCDLDEGPNTNINIHVKVLMGISASGSPVSTFLALDYKGNIFALSIFHLDETTQSRLGSAKENISISDPLLRTTILDNHRYQSIQVQHPAHVSLNGRQLHSAFAHASMATSTI
eukprot:CAMPEP_0171510682 /NCGR_PEP_ID=MMETSP0959-20130129/527_1 /TAXON_ID=87120 /ORGANISM="Aurantiochytrium limacinum, Strain ATCCMYA-1381" /LENGTH=447 /DNA_ID=CAMNT_0012048129 /DNA_START=243 /DNA_END=1583 /DNA_ORIENTATION=-